MTIFSIQINPERFHHDFLFPENLDLLPNWITFVLGEWEHLSGCVVRLDVHRPVTWGTVDELEQLRNWTSITLSNSDLTKEERGGYPMCSTLSTTFSIVRGAMLDALATASYELSKKQYILGRYSMEESPHGKRFLHQIDNDLTEHSTYADYPGLGDGRGDVGQLRLDSEEMVQDVAVLKRLLEKPVRRANYLTGV